MPDKGRETSSRVGIAGPQRDRARCDVILLVPLRRATKIEINAAREKKGEGDKRDVTEERSRSRHRKKNYFRHSWFHKLLASQRPHKDSPFRPFSPSCRVGEKSSSYCNELGKLHMGRIAHEEVSSLRMISCIYCSCKRRSLSSRFSCGSCTRRGTLKQPRDQDSKVPK